MSTPTKAIICIVGPSGSGKTFIADYLESEYDIPIIQSRTTRPRRTPTENGHTFISEQMFDTYDYDDMLAFTEWSGYRYCCLKDDVVADMSSYVIDEKGLLYLKENFSHIYEIYTIRIDADKNLREEKVGEERVARDEGKFNLPIDFFDYSLYNDYQTANTHRKADRIISRILFTHECNNI